MAGFVIEREIPGQPGTWEVWSRYDSEEAARRGLLIFTNSYQDKFRLVPSEQPSTTIPEGWSHDKGDPSVGIFGDQWVHEACEVLAGPGNTELKGCTEDSVQISEPDQHGTAKFLYTITCQDCQSVAVFETTDLALVED